MRAHTHTEIGGEEEEGGNINVAALAAVSATKGRSGNEEEKEVGKLGFHDQSSFVV